jgi:hypothetical protein
MRVSGLILRRWREARNETVSMRYDVFPCLCQLGMDPLRHDAVMRHEAANHRSCIPKRSQGPFYYGIAVELFNG